MIQTGISLYLGSGMKKNLEVIQKAYKAHATYAFTSLHIPEEQVQDYQKEVKELLEACKQHNLHLFVDVGPRTLDKLGYVSFDELAQSGITHIRLDYGFSYEEIVRLSKQFHIVFNASTFMEEDIEALQQLHADFTRFLACHNFYPKPLTALSLQKVANMNQRMKQLGMKTMAFVAGDKDLRGPLHAGLPTVEEHRYGDIVLHMLELNKVAQSDICLIGDIDVTDDTWKKMEELQEGYVSLHAQIDEAYCFVKDMIHHDRPDSSDYVIRSQESRGYATQGAIISKEASKPRPVGAISIGNEEYLRYSGELEIARKDLDIEPKVNIIGYIDEKDLCYLPYIIDGMGFKFK